MLIQVTEQDYAEAERFSATNCAIARALNRQLGVISEVRAGCIKLHNGSTTVEVETPLMGSLTSRIYDFDTYGAGQPFSFALNYKGDGLEMEYSESIAEELVLA